MGHLTQLINFGAPPLRHRTGRRFKAHAFLNHRGYVTPEDVRAVSGRIRHALV